MLQNLDVIWLDNQEDIKALICFHLKDLFKADDVSSQVTNQQALDSDLILRELDLPCLLASEVSLLQAPLEESKVKKALSSIGNFKSPGADGFSFAFFKHF